jgi:hypothetical protein
MESRRKETLAEEKSWELTAQLGEWSQESTELQARLNDAEVRCGVLSASSSLMRTDPRVAEEKQRAAEEGQRVAEDKQKAVEESQLVLTKKLEKAKSRMRRLMKKYKHYKSEAAQYFKQL